MKPGNILGGTLACIVRPGVNVDCIFKVTQAFWRKFVLNMKSEMFQCVSVLGILTG